MSPPGSGALAVHAGPKRHHARPSSGARPAADKSQLTAVHGQNRCGVARVIQFEFVVRLRRESVSRPSSLSANTGVAQATSSSRQARRSATARSVSPGEIPTSPGAPVSGYPWSHQGEVPLRRESRLRPSSFCRMKACPPPSAAGPGGFLDQPDATAIRPGGVAEEVADPAGRATTARRQVSRPPSSRCRPPPSRVQPAERRASGTGRPHRDPQRRGRWHRSRASSPHASLYTNPRRYSGRSPAPASCPARSTLQLRGRLLRPATWS